MLSKETYRDIFGYNTSEYYEENVLMKPKRYISETLSNQKKEIGISFSMLNKKLKEQNFKYVTTMSQYYQQTKHLGNYKIDGLLRMLDALDLELVIRPKSK